MRRFFDYQSLICFFLALPLTVAAVENGDFLSLQKRLIGIFEENKDAIVHVKAAYQRLTESGDPDIEVRMGTGFFISREGHILTNAVLASDADRVWIVHNGIEYPAESVGDDKPNNLSLLQLSNLPRKFNFLHLTDSPDLPAIGTMVVRLSTPFALDPTPYLGIIAGQESGFGERMFPCTYIRTSIPRAVGEDGAPLLDFNGNLVGVQIGILRELQASYFLPTRAALRIRDDLLFSGKVTYGWIGFDVEEQNTIKNGMQIVLSKIYPETPAESAGMFPGDVLVNIGDYDIKQVSDVRNAIFYTREGQFVSIKVIRDGEEFDYNMRVTTKKIEELVEGRDLLQTFTKNEIVQTLPLELPPETTREPPEELMEETPESESVSETGETPANPDSTGSS